jgi:2,3-bisphosphoglycerate-dependent phosphoglycerate mutase
VRFVVIRHGQSTNNLLWEQTGGSEGRDHDPALTELGHVQARRLAATVADGVLPWAITQLHCSLMTRAVQTAAPLADALDLPLQGHLEVHETGGVYVEAPEGLRTPHPGAAQDELRALSARLVLPEITLAEGWFPGPYEDGDAPAHRARRVVAALRAQHADDDVVALVSHGAFFQHLFRAFLGIEEMTGWVVKHNTAISLFEDEPLTDGATVSAARVDWMPHLSDDLVSL